MRPLLALAFVLVSAGLGLLWLRASGARGGIPENAPMEPIAAPPARSVLAPAPVDPRGERAESAPTVAAPEEEPSAAEEAVPDAAGLSGTIHGLVRGPGGVELANVEARVVDARGSVWEVVKRPGKYAVSGLAAGHYWLAVGARGYRRKFAEVELATGGEERLDFELEEALRLDVLVLDRDRRPLVERVKPAFGGLVAVARANVIQDWDRELEGAERRYGLGRFRPHRERAFEGGIGTLELEGDLPAWVHLCLGQRVLAARRVEAGTSEVVFVLADPLPTQLGTLRVRALDAAGVALPLVSVHVNSGSGGVMTNGRGQERVEIANLAPGDYLLLVMAQGGKLQTRSVLLQGGVQDVDVEVDTALRLTGQVVDGAGVPLGAEDPESGDGPAVLLGRIGLGASTVQWEDMRYLVDEEGRFELALAPGTYALRAEHEGSLSSALRVDLRHGPLEDVELAFPEPVALVLQRERGEWRGARYELSDEGGLTAFEGSFAGPEPLALPVTKGRYRLLVELDGLRVHDATLVLERATTTHRCGW